MKHINIPVFIPHLGCPNKCVFCDQNTISGSDCFIEANAKATIEASLATAGERECEIAFFGGSFTGIERSLMIRLLNLAESYVGDGRVCGIRLSTRPDYIDEEIIGILKRYTVTTVELGIQSMSESVLNLCRRGHTADASRKAAELLYGAGLLFVGQMMTCLPGSTAGDELYCADAICDMHAVGARIYPTVVFKDTELYEMTIKGAYEAPPFDEVIRRTAAVMRVFIGRGVDILRVGLCESENLHSESYYAGVNHPALGELYESELYYDLICRKIDEKRLHDCEITLQVSPGEISKAVGHGGVNKLRIQNKYNVKIAKVIENREMLRYNIGGL